MELKYSFNNCSFNKDVAIKYGVDIAILINWFRNKGLHEKVLFGVEVFENKIFVEFIISIIQSNFPFWKNRKIRAILRDAVDKKVLIKENLNNNRKIHNMWYAINI